MTQQKIESAYWGPAREDSRVYINIQYIIYIYYYIYKYTLFCFNETTRGSTVVPCCTNISAIAAQSEGGVESQRSCLVKNLVTFNRL